MCTFASVLIISTKNEDIFPVACINIWKDFSNKNLRQAYIGFSGGIQFSF